MKHRGFSFISITLIVLSHFVLIPILSAFGLNACPLLLEQGFLFGCQYSASLVASVLATQMVFILTSGWVFLKFSKKLNLPPPILKLFPLFSLFIHILNFYYFSQIYQTKLSEHTPHSKEVQLFLYVCMSLIVVLTWQWLEVETLFHLRRLNLHPQTTSTHAKDHLIYLWITEQKNRFIPLFGVVSFFSCYFLLFLEANNSNEDLAESLKNQQSRFVYLAGIILLWQSILFFFEFYKNIYFINQVEHHLKNFNNQNWKYHSNLSLSGFYGFIFKLLNQLSTTMQKKTRLLKGFSTFVSESVANELLDNEVHSQIGTQKQVAILVADIRDFTQLSSRLKPQEVVDLLNIYFTDMLEIFIEYGVTLDKFIGDGILAYIPIDEDNLLINLENITKAAFEMHFKINQTNQKLKNKKLPKIQLGVSLHVGSVILGSIGSKNKLQYTIIGDPVNVASRLEGFCKEQQVGIIASSHFISRISNNMKLKFINLGRQKIRGIDLPMEIFGAIPQEKKSIAL